MKYLVNFLATGFFVGYIPKAPGTFGTIIGLILIIVFTYGFQGSILPSETSLPWLTAATIFISLLGIYISNLYINRIKQQDPKQVVIDEIAGIFVTYLIFLFLLQQFPTYSSLCDDRVFEITALYNSLNIKGNPLFITGLVKSIIFYLITPFILFRFFDILKPYPISYADKNIKNGLGIMLDDIIAGVAAGGVCYSLLYFFNKTVYISKDYCG